MTLRTGLIPIFIFVLTLGLATPITLGAHLSYRAGNGSFGAALRAAVLEAGALYLVGILVIWAIADGSNFWEIPITLLITGVIAFLILLVLPLLAGQRVIREASDVDAETALRFATYGWPLAMLVVFGVFIAPGGLIHGTLLSLGGEQICLVGFCGILISFVAALLLELVVAILGPRFLGLIIYCRTKVLIILFTPGG